MNSNSQLNTYTDLVSDPELRFRKFFDFNTKIEIDPKYNIEKYIRSGRQILRMADVYFSEHDYLHAFILYSRFAVLYGHCLKTHPEYSKCNKADILEINRELNTIVFPKAEKLKLYIKEIFSNEAKEHQRMLAEQKIIDKLNNNEQEKNKILAQNEHEFNNFKENLINDIVSDIGQSSNSKYNFRKIILPNDSIDKFLEKAYANTMQNVETCGILAGQLTQNKFFISHVVIPKQKGTSDTCSTQNENELCQVIDQNNLITLGWIHTHPSQTAFLSSIDLHTHYGYQLMIPEAIAIVCAPSYNQNSIFVLNPDGFKEISQCGLSGFHPHSKIPQLFEVKKNFFQLFLIKFLNIYF
ncbi:STAM-binding -like A [Brachionus plicatilis]|uniref:STAM-binding-like A n=1 Tax=Brachionus plicatilis TaxID=10195 RepID=A0A3M7S9N3_BRAPC|nr:STAM-binding -like A [Brachionus plicatilis]